MSKLLSILIPTYNRASYLKRLLEALQDELSGLEGLVNVLVSDNGSTDATQDVTNDLLGRMKVLYVKRYPENLGMDENFCGCVEADDSDYFWLLGDDDLPRAGAIHCLLEMLTNQQPDLVYMESVWRRDVLADTPKGPLRSISYVELTCDAFARRVNIWTTFISGTIVRRATFVQRASSQELRKYGTTNLPQLAWVFGTLRQGNKFYYVPQPCVLATSGNTGGYAVLNVFGKHFPAIVNHEFGRYTNIARAMIFRSAVGFLPGLAWRVRQGSAGNFSAVQASSAPMQTTDADALSRFVIRVMNSDSRVCALIFRIAFAILARILSLRDRLIESFCRKGRIHRRSDAKIR